MLTKNSWQHLATDIVHSHYGTGLKLEWVMVNLHILIQWVTFSPDRMDQMKGIIWFIILKWQPWIQSTCHDQHQTVTVLNIILCCLIYMYLKECYWCLVEEKNMKELS